METKILNKKRKLLIDYLHELGFEIEDLAILFPDILTLNPHYEDDYS